jgi:hypothetical protein
MPQVDFSETKRQFAFLKMALMGGRPEDAQKIAGSVFGPLVTKLDFKQTVMWSVFAGVSVSSMIMILWFIDSFNREQDKYQMTLTSIGRNHAEYNDLNGAFGTTTEQPIAL